MEQPSSPVQRRCDRARLSGRQWLALGLLLGCSSCGVIPTAPPLTPPMSVQPPLRKQVLQGYMPFGSIGWVNNRQVVFHGVPQTTNAAKKNLYTWDLKSKPQERLKRSHNSCVSKGTIRTSQFADQAQPKDFILKEPDFIPQSRLIERAPRLSIFDPVSCTWIATPAILKGRDWRPLQNREGFLDLDSPSNIPGIQAVRHLSADLRSTHDTGIRMERPMLPKVVHAAHDDTYLVFNLNASPAEERRWIDTGNRIIWRLDRQLQGRPLSVPAGPWVSVGAGTISFLSARPGLLILSNNFGRRGAPGGAGLYLLAPGRAAQRLERGLVQEPAVSPDGCRVAYGFRPRLDTGIPEGGPRLVVLDLCDTIAPRQR